MTDQIERHQVYRACSPTMRGPQRIQVVAYNPGTRTVTVVDYANLRVEYEFPASYFHDSDRTKTGAKRRTGYALETS